MAANDGDRAHAVTDLFGFHLPDSTGAGGSEGSRPPAPDNETGVEVTPPTGTWQDRHSADSGGTSQPGQFSGVGALMGLEDDFVTSTGAGSGRAGHFPRRDFQQPDGEGT